MKADNKLTEIQDDKGLIHTTVIIRGRGDSILMYVVARVECNESTQELMDRAERIADALTEDRPKRDSASQRAAD